MPSSCETFASAEIDEPRTLLEAPAEREATNPCAAPGKNASFVVVTKP